MVRPWLCSVWYWASVRDQVASVTVIVPMLVRSLAARAVISAALPESVKESLATKWIPAVLMASNCATVSATVLVA